ncbi:MAG: hypothetical protein AB1412_09400 [Pseudomonadota bacterium]
MRVILEYAHWHGGTLYMSGSVLSLDDSSARWLIAKGLADAVEDEADPDADAQIAGDAPQPEPAPRRTRGKTLPTPALPASGEGAVTPPPRRGEGVFAPPPRSGGGGEGGAVSPVSPESLSTQESDQ